MRSTFSKCSYWLFNWNIKPDFIRSRMCLFFLLLSSQDARAITIVCFFWSGCFFPLIYVISLVFAQYIRRTYYYIRKVMNAVRSIFCLLKCTLYINKLHTIHLSGENIVFLIFQLLILLRSLNAQVTGFCFCF